MKAEYSHPSLASKPSRSWYSSFSIGRVHFQSIRDLQYAVQMAAAIVFCFLISYNSEYKNHVLIAWVLPTLSGLVIADTLGGTLLAARVGIVNFVPTSLFIYILQKIGMGYHNYASSTILFFCVTFFIGYANPMTIPRKIALVLPAILFTTLVTTPRVYIKDTFIWELLAESLIAIGVAVGTSFLVFPRYASTEIHDRVSYNISKIAEIFELSILSMMATHRAEADVYLTEADHLFANLTDNQDNMNVRLYMSQFEPAELLRNVIRYYQPLYLNFSLQELVSMSSTLLWHCNSMIHAVRNINFNEYHADTANSSRVAFLLIAKKLKQVTEIVQYNQYSGSSYQEEVDRLIKELLEHCDAAYEALSLSLKVADDHERSHRLEEDKGSNLSQESEKYDKALKGIHAMTEHYDDYVPSGDGIFLFDGNKKSVTNEKELPLSYDLDARKGGNRLTFSFFAFHLTELTQAIGNRFHSKSIAAMKEAKEKAAKDARDKVKNYFYEVILLPWIVYYQGILNNYLADYQNKCKTGLRTAILMGVSIIFVEVPILASKFEQGQWIMFAMIFSVGDSFGGTIAQMRLRFLGTLFGAIYAYFIYIAITDNNSNDDFNLKDTQTIYYIIAMLVPFIIMNGMIKQNKLWSYFGSIAVTTALIVTLGRIPYANPIVGNYSLLRIQQNALGICIVFVVSLISIPVFAIDLLKGHMKDVMFLMLKSVEKIANVYEKEIVLHESLKNENANLMATTEHMKILDQQYQQFLEQIGLTASANSSVSPSSRQDSEEEKRQQVMSMQDPLLQSTGFAIHDRGLSGKELRDLNASSQQLQKINYLFTENLAINYKLSQQWVFMPQAAMESIYGNKPFPEQLYQKVIGTETKILQLLLSMDRILLRLQIFLSISSVHNILVTFISQFTIHLKQLFNKVKECLQMTLRQLQSSVIISDDAILRLLRTGLTVSLSCFSNATASVGNGNRGEPEDESDRGEKDEERRAFVRKRSVHAQLMNELNYHAMKIFILSQEFNHLLFHDWLTEVLVQSGVLPNDHVLGATAKGDTSTSHNASDWLQKESELLRQKRDEHEAHRCGEKAIPLIPISADLEAGKTGNIGNYDIVDDKSAISSSQIIHRLFSVLTTFNGLFYATSHMGRTVIELSNLIFTITELETQVEHNPF